jgi:hypothetical protein
VLNVGLGVSFDNMQDCEGILEKAWDVNSAKAYSKQMRLYTDFSKGVAPVL